MWNKLREGVAWLAANRRMISPASVKTSRYEIRAATVGGVIRIMQALHNEAHPGADSRLVGRRRGTRSAHHSERPDRRP